MSFLTNLSTSTRVLRQSGLQLSTTTPNWLTRLQLSLLRLNRACAWRCNRKWGSVNCTHDTLNGSRLDALPDKLGLFSTLESLIVNGWLNIYWNCLFKVTESLASVGWIPLPPPTVKSDTCDEQYQQTNRGFLISKELVIKNLVWVIWINNDG